MLVSVSTVENILCFLSINSFDFKFQEMDFEENSANNRYDSGSTEVSSSS